MTKSKKTKIHKKIDGQLLQMNKKFSDLKMKQKDKIIMEERNHNFKRDWIMKR
mgnify:CR=1 FL=1